MDIESCTPELWIANEIEWLKCLESDAVWASIPLLNVNEPHNLPRSTTTSLVRFRGMIQDSFGPEYYLDEFEVIDVNTGRSEMKRGKFRDDTDCQEHETINLEGPSSVMKDRQTFVVISTPAHNSWAKIIEEKKYKLSEKSNTNTTTNNNNKQTKRALDDEDMELNDLLATTTNNHINNQSNSHNNTNKKQHVAAATATTEDNNVNAASLLSKESILNLPVPDATGKVCHMIVYHNKDMCHINMMFEFVGFLSIEAPHNDGHLVEDNEIEFQIHNPPRSLVPRIHCVSFRKLMHSNPLIDGGGLVAATMPSERMEYVKRELLSRLTQMLCGDELAAEYFLYHFISQVYLRKDFMAIGKFSLNLSNLPHVNNIDYPKELYKFIELILPKSHYLPMTLENMNEMAFVPKKDYNSNRLTSSVLQLSANTHIVLDETKLTEGKLNEAGIQGIKALSDVIRNQKVLIDFTFYQVNFDCDLPILIMSDGKSMLPSDVHVIMRPDNDNLPILSETIEAAKYFLNPDLLNEIRVYLTLARSLTYEISDAMQELIQQEFVELRQKRNITADDLHHLLVLTRLVSMSEGKTVPDEECWRKACKLEEKRTERIAN